MKVRIGPTMRYGGVIPATFVNVDRDGVVTNAAGQTIGRVWKGERTYSPPVSRGSRVAKYHKQVPEWHGSPDVRESVWPDIREDTRREVIEELWLMSKKERPA